MTHPPIWMLWFSWFVSLGVAARAVAELIVDFLSWLESLVKK